MRSLRELPLVDAAVARDATFGEAARTLRDAGISAIAVLDGDRRVVGLFTEDDLLAGLFPRYLRELRHTAFARDDEQALAERAREAADEPVERHMSEPIVLDIETSALHAAERFLHCEWGALAVTEGGRCVGMLSELDFVRRLLDRLGLG